MPSRLKKAAVAVPLLVAGLFLASPAQACLRMHQVRFEPDSTQMVDSGPIADFLAVGSYGARQKIIVRVSGPDFALVQRRAAALGDLLQAYGLDPRGIMIESNVGRREDASLVIYPQRRLAPDADAVAQAGKPPGPACGYAPA